MARANKYPRWVPGCFYVAFRAMRGIFRPCGTQREKTNGYNMMKKLFLGSLFYFVAAACAVAGPGYYEMRISDCSPAAMQRAMDDAAARNRSVITVVKCDAAPAPRPVRVTHRAARPFPRHVNYIDYGCGCAPVISGVTDICCL